MPSGCTAEDEVFIQYDVINLPEILSVTTCVDNNGFGVFNLFDVSSLIDANLQVLNFYNTLVDAQSGANPITDSNNYPNDDPNEVVFVRILSPGNCIAIQEVFLSGLANEFEEVNFTVCPALESSPTSFGTLAVTNKVSETLNIDSSNVSLFYSESDAIAQTNEIFSGFLEIETDLLPLTVYARLESDAECLGLAPVVLQKIEGPQFLDNTLDYLICEGEDNSIMLNASLTNPDGEVLYEWDTGETTETITVEESGNYRVDVTIIRSIEGQEIVCTNFKNFNIIASSAPEVSYTQTGFVGIENELIITASGSGDYEYALNDSGYIDSNVFNVTDIENTLFVRDKNGCGEVSINFVSLNIPGFFTPNGDGFNDYWQIGGIRQNENDVKTIYIFDRYGKLIFESSPQLIGWDGTYNGAPVPSQDYWYKIELNSGQSISGHLTLKR